MTHRRGMGEGTSSEGSSDLPSAIVGGVPTADQSAMTPVGTQPATFAGRTFVSPASASAKKRKRCIVYSLILGVALFCIIAVLVVVLKFHARSTPHQEPILGSDPGTLPPIMDVPLATQKPTLQREPPLQCSYLRPAWNARLGKTPEYFPAKDAGGASRLDAYTWLEDVEEVREISREICSFGTRVAGSYSSGANKTLRLLQEYISHCLPPADTDAEVNPMKIEWIPMWDNFTDTTPMGKRRFSNLVYRMGRPGAKGDAETTLPSPSEHLVLAAHWDSKLYKDFHFVGASDSVVPVAMLLHTMRQLSQATMGLGRAEIAALPNVTVIFFDGEEAFVQWTRTDSTYGSRHLAKQWEATGELKQISAFVLLDLIGGSSPTFHNYFPGQTNSPYQQLVQLEQAFFNSGLKKRPNLHRSFPAERSFWGRIEDDHIPWLERGVPILHLITSPFPRFWHEEGDKFENMDWKFTYDVHAVISKWVVNYLRLMSSPLKP